MPLVRINKGQNSAIYFLTITTRSWYYVLDRYGRWNIIADSLKFFQKNRGLKIYGFVFMTNHIHLLIFSPDAISFIRDFKKFTTKEIIGNIEKTEPSILKLFINKKNKIQLWKKTNMPGLVESEKFFNQKMEYIHNNPLKRVYVTRPEHWYWSSANSDCELEVDNVYEE